MDDLDHPLRYSFRYATGFIFLIGIMIYLYILFGDHLEESTHSTEEKVWIYLYLVVLVLGFALSYYLINCSIYCVNKKGVNGYAWGGIVKKDILSRPTKGQHNKISSVRGII